MNKVSNLQPVPESAAKQEDTNLLALFTLEYDQMKNDLIFSNKRFRENYLNLLENIQGKSEEEKLEIVEKLRNLNENFAGEIEAMTKKIKDLNDLNTEKENLPISKEIMELRSKVRELDEKW